MRVALVTRLYAPEPAAAAFRLAALAEALATAGHDVTVLTSRPPRGSRAVGEVAGIRVRRWPVRRSRDGQVRGYLSYLSFDVPALFRLLALRRVDLVISEPPPTTGAVVTLAAALRRLPHVHYAADCWSDATAAAGAPGPVVAVVRWLEGLTVRSAAGVVTVNEAIAARFTELHPSARVTVVGNGVDTRVFRPQGEKRTEPRPFAVYAGTTSEWQGAEVIVDAWAQVVRARPGIDLVFVGGGSRWQSLAERARALGLEQSIRFVPTVPALEAATWLRSAVVSLVSLRPGLGYDYALPTKVLASLASGTPVVFSGEGVTRDFLRAIPAESAAGSVGVGDSADAIAAAVTAVVDAGPQPAARERLAAWAAEEVSLAAVAQRVRGVAEGIVAERRRRS